MREPGRLLRDRGVAGDDLAEGVVLGAGVAGLGEGGVVVVGGDDRGVALVVVGAVGEAEVGAAVEHVDVDGGAGGQQLVEVGGGARRVPDVVLLAPVVEPADPELRAHQRPFGHVGPQRLQRLLDPAAEGGGGQDAGQAAGGQVVAGARLVAGEEQFLDAPCTQRLVDVLEVRGVVAVRPVLVLHLDGDDRAVVRGHVRQQRGQQDVEVAVEGVGEAGVAGAQPDVGVRGQPGGQAAAVPLGADVRAGAQQDVQALGAGEPQIAGQVEQAVEDERAVRVGLVEVPGDVRLHGVEAHQPGLAQPVGPQVGVDAEVVHRAGDDPERLTVQEETVGRRGQSGRAQG